MTTAAAATKPVWKKVLVVSAWVLGAIVLAVLVALCAIIYPGKPSGARTLNFQGYVTLPGSSGLNVLDYLTLRDRSLFVTAESSGSVDRVDFGPAELPANANVTHMGGTGATHGVALVPDNPALAFVTRSETNTVDAFNPQTMQIIKSIPVAEDADAIIYDPDTRLIYVANGDAHLATLIDPAKMATVGTIALEGKPEFPALDSVRHLLYQNLRDINEVAVVDLHTRSEVGKWSLPNCEGPTGMILDAAADRLFVICAVNARLVVLNLESHAEIANLPIGGGPDSVVFDPALHQIYTAGKSGFLVVIHQDSPDLYKVVDSIRTHYGAHTLAVDRKTHMVFLGYASLLVDPRIAVFSATP